MLPSLLINVSVRSRYAPIPAPEATMTEQTRTAPEPLTPVAQKFILHWGEMGTKWGINRTVAQVHALLFRFSQATACRRYLRHPRGCALQRQHQPARTPGLGNRSCGSCLGRSPRPLRNHQRCLGNLPHRFRRTEAPRDRSHSPRPGRMRPGTENMLPPTPIPASASKPCSNS